MIQYSYRTKTNIMAKTLTVKALEANKPANENIGRRNLWADRFTRASVALYGQPDADEAGRLLTKEYQSLLQLKGRADVSQRHVNLLLKTYKPLVGGQETASSGAEQTAERKRLAVQEYGKAMLDMYRPLIELVDNAGTDVFDVVSLRELFGDALYWLEDHDDPDWADWQVVDDPNGSSLSVESTTRIIKIPSGRELVSAGEAKGLIAHELLVHALRGKNGYQTGTEELATGLPGYRNTEEGLAILAEEAVTGELPSKAYDRYVDIALALGVCDGAQKTRHELFQISFARQLIREQANGTFTEVEALTLEQRVWRHIDRIYRGGPVDKLDAHQAISTRDVAYYVGYKQMAQYITRQLDAGQPAAEIFQYLSSGKFDPNNAQHVERMSESFNSEARLHGPTGY
jgi:hypothetical protein